MTTFKKNRSKKFEDLLKSKRSNLKPVYYGFKFSNKKEILDQLENSHKLEIPKNLIDIEVKSLPNTPEKR